MLIYVVLFLLAKEMKKLMMCSEIIIVCADNHMKHTCTLCGQTAVLNVKVFDTLQYKYTAVELDNRADGHAIQNILEHMTGARTVPRIFVRGKCLGGCSDIKELYNSGKLVEILRGK